MHRTLINIGPRQIAVFCLALTAFELLTYMASDLLMPAMLSVTAELHADARHVPHAFNLYLLGASACNGCWGHCRIAGGDDGCC